MVLYTCPAGETALLKCLTVVNNAALANTFTLKLNGTTNGSALLELNVLASEGQAIRDLFIVLQPGDVLRGIATSASAVCAGFGAELEGVAD